MDLVLEHSIVADVSSDFADEAHAPHQTLGQQRRGLPEGRRGRIRTEPGRRPRTAGGVDGGGRDVLMRAAIGVTVKSGWACVVLVAGSAARPRVIDSRRIELSDPAIPESRQPYHAGFGTARSAGADRARLVAG